MDRVYSFYSDYSLYSNYRKNQKNRKKMKKILLSIAIVLASAVSMQAQTQDNNTPGKERMEVMKDSLRSKGDRWGKRISEGAALAADSLTAKGSRLSRRGAVVGRKVMDGAAEAADSIGQATIRFTDRTKVKMDTISTRTRKAVKALQGK